MQVNRTNNHAQSVGTVLGALDDLGGGQPSPPSPGSIGRASLVVATPRGHRDPGRPTLPAAEPARRRHRYQVGSFNTVKSQSGSTPSRLAASPTDPLHASTTSVALCFRSTRALLTLVSASAKAASAPLKRAARDSILFSCDVTIRRTLDPTSALPPVGAKVCVDAHPTTLRQWSPCSREFSFVGRGVAPSSDRPGGPV